MDSVVVAPRCGGSGRLGRALRTACAAYRAIGALLLLLPSLLIFHGAVRAAEADFLDPEVAFRLSVAPAGERALQVDFTIAPGYYLYREQFRFEAGDARVGVPVIPPGHVKFDETFQKEVEVYRDRVTLIVPITDARRTIDLVVVNQGCADRGLCYPPQQRGVRASLVGYGGDGRVSLLDAAASEALAASLSSGVAAGSVGGAAAPSALTPDGDRDGGIERALRSGRLWTVVGVFFLAGVLLSLTPCVLPMLPILSSIIVGQGAVRSRRRGLALAATYALGMAAVYTALGVAAGLAGEGLAATLQQPWVLMAFAAGLGVLAASMFGAFELQLPAAWTGRVSGASQRLPGGRFAGVLAMGGVSALLVSPCVAAPLAGALVYISQTRDVLLGGTALFALAAGMGVPLLAVGASAGVLLPRAGAWMDDVKRFFGWVLLGVAWWTVQPLLPPRLGLVGWGALAIGAAATLLFGIARPSRRGAARFAVAGVLGLLGLGQWLGAAGGAVDPLSPLAAWRGGATSGAAAESAGPPFEAVRSVAELDAALARAGRPVMLDFYADWCVSCKEMERETFVDPAVRRRLDGALLLRADVTANNAEDRALLKRFGLFGPPGIVFFGASGREVPGSRVIGFENAGRFDASLARAGL